MATLGAVGGFTSAAERNCAARQFSEQAHFDDYCFFEWCRQTFSKLKCIEDFTDARDSGYMNTGSSETGFSARSSTDDEAAQQDRRVRRFSVFAQVMSINASAGRRRHHADGLMLDGGKSDEPDRRWRFRWQR